jgi:hypothetical protein
MGVLRSISSSSRNRTPRSVTVPSSLTNVPSQEHWYLPHFRSVGVNVPATPSACARSPFAASTNEAILPPAVSNRRNPKRTQNITRPVLLIGFSGLRRTGECYPAPGSTRPDLLIGGEVTR